MEKAESNAGRDAYVITGPTSGVGRETAMRMATQGTLVLVGRNREKLDRIKKDIERLGGHAIPVVCDMSDLTSVRRAAGEIIALNLNIAGLVNNAGIQNPRVAKTADGWDNTFVTNHLGPFALTDLLLAHLPDGAKVLFVGSATEDPDRGMARRAGFRGGRYLSAEASLRGEWKPGGSAQPAMDAYATSKQCNIVSALALARENPRLHINAIEPGVMFATGLHEHAPAFRKILVSVLAPLLVRFVKVVSTPRRAAQVITAILLETPGATGLYYDEGGHPMPGSERVRDPGFQDQVVSETRALLRRLSA